MFVGRCHRAWSTSCHFVDVACDSTHLNRSARRLLILEDLNEPVFVERNVMHDINGIFRTQLGCVRPFLSAPRHRPVDIQGREMKGRQVCIESARRCAMIVCGGRCLQVAAAVGRAFAGGGCPRRGAGRFFTALHWPSSACSWPSTALHWPSSACSWPSTALHWPSSACP